MVNWKGYGRKPQWPNLGIISAYVFRDYRKIMRANVLAGILTGHLSNIRLERYLQYSGTIPDLLRTLHYGHANTM
jgi:hypothetical protein